MPFYIAGCVVVILLFVIGARAIHKDMARLRSQKNEAQRQAEKTYNDWLATTKGNAKPKSGKVRGVRDQ